MSESVAKMKKNVKTIKYYISSLGVTDVQGRRVRESKSLLL